MSEIAPLEKLEGFLAQVPSAATTSSTVPRNEPKEARSGMVNSGCGSQLELFFSEVKYPTFVEKREPKLRAKFYESRSSNSSVGALKFRLRLH